MSTAIMKRALGFGVLAAALNGLCWIWFVRTFVPLDVEMPELIQPPAQPNSTPGEVVISGDALCVHCPQFSLANRGVLGGYAPIHFELLATANAIPLYLSANETLRYGIRVVDPLRFAAWATFQWLALGLAGGVLWHRISSGRSSAQLQGR